MECHSTLRPHNILLVDDDVVLSSNIADELQQQGYSATRVLDSEQALEAVQTQSYDLIIADRVMPGMDGLSLIKRLRDDGNHVPVLVLSSLSAVDERVRGLKAGGDDYLVKPFAFDELIARVEALLRRPRETRETVLRAGSLTMDLVDRSVRRAGLIIELLPREFKLLEYLMRRPNQVVTRAMLFEDVWNYNFTPNSNLVDVHIGKLRRKIDAPGGTSLIESVVGSGFILRAPD
jgi:two-component system OmpR family response regulator